MKLEVGDWDSEKTTQYWLVIDIDQALALAGSGPVLFLEGQYV